jgi:hypothetical protein
MLLGLLAASQLFAAQATLPGVEGFWAAAFVEERAGWLVGTEGRIFKVSF